MTDTHVLSRSCSALWAGVGGAVVVGADVVDGATVVAAVPPGPPGTVVPPAGPPGTVVCAALVVVAAEAASTTTSCSLLGSDICSPLTVRTVSLTSRVTACGVTSTVVDSPAMSAFTGSLLANTVNVSPSISPGYSHATSNESASSTVATKLNGACSCGACSVVAQSCGLSDELSTPSGPFAWTAKQCTSPGPRPVTTWVSVAASTGSNTGPEICPVSVVRRMS